jgi:hypothetical protein
MRAGPLLVPVLLGACALPRPGAGVLSSDRVCAAPTDTALSVTTARPVRATTPPHQMGLPRPRNYVDFMMGASYWDHLGSLDPTGVSPIPGAYGDFDRWSFAFDMGYDRVVARGDRTDLALGLEMGWSTFENDGAGLVSPSTTISSSFFYIAPVTRLLWHVSPTVTVSPGIGAGYYALHIDEYDTYYYGWWWGYSGRTLNEDSAFGGFASLAVDFHLSPTNAIRFDNKVHFVEFDGLESLYPNETKVRGPIWTIELGFVLAF